MKGNRSENLEAKLQVGNAPTHPIVDFWDEDGNDRMQEEIQANYNRIKQIIEDEMESIKNDPELQHLAKSEEK